MQDPNKDQPANILRAKIASVGEDYVTFDGKDSTDVGRCLDALCEFLGVAGGSHVHWPLEGEIDAAGERTFYFNPALSRAQYAALTMKYVMHLDNLLDAIMKKEHRS